MLGPPAAVLQLLELVESLLHLVAAEAHRHGQVAVDRVEELGGLGVRVEGPQAVVVEQAMCTSNRSLAFLLPPAAPMATPEP